MLKGFAVDKEERGISTKALLNEVYQQDQLVMTGYHLSYYSVWSARLHLAKTPIKCANLKRHLETLIMIYGLNELHRDSGGLFDCGYFIPGKISSITVLDILKR